MALLPCPECSQSISEDASTCPHCGKKLTWTMVAAAQGLRYNEVTQQVARGQRVDILMDTRRRMTWFLTVNVAIALSVIILSGGGLWWLAIIAFLVGLTVPFISLLRSKNAAIRAYNVTLIQPENFANEYEEQLYELVRSIGERAGLETTPAVGYYETDEANAFATGANRNDSLVAVSTGLLRQLDDGATAAVIAHEVAHIANGDMATMALVQTAINTVVFLITLPLWLLSLVSLFSSEIGWVTDLIVRAFAWLVTVVLLFLGNLVAKTFSRRREFSADELAAQLVSRESMVQALRSLAASPAGKLTKEQAAFAAFQINAPSRIWDIFSTHPSIERRIKALEEM